MTDIKLDKSEIIPMQQAVIAWQKYETYAKKMLNGNPPVEQIKDGVISIGYIVEDDFVEVFKMKNIWLGVLTTIRESTIVAKATDIALETDNEQIVELPEDANNTDDNDDETEIIYRWKWVDEMSSDEDALLIRQVKEKLLETYPGIPNEFWTKEIHLIRYINAIATNILNLDTFVSMPINNYNSLIFGRQLIVPDADVINNDIPVPDADA